VFPRLGGTARLSDERENFVWDFTQGLNKGAFTLANFARDFALSLHVLLNKNDLFYLLNVQASAKSRAKSRQCKCTFIDAFKVYFLLIRVSIT
jgi:hypothetical protein